MVSLSFLWAKLVKKLHGRAITASHLDKTVGIGAGSHLVSAVMGRYSYCGSDCEFLSCEIGSFCSISHHVTIGGALHPMDWVTTSPAFHYGRGIISKRLARLTYDAVPPTTVIEHDVWIGAYAMIKSGVHIGTGAVVGMGSVVTKDVPPYTVVAGNPAVVIRSRFEEHVCTALLRSRWWTWSDDKLIAAAPYMNDVPSFLQKENLL